MKGGWDISSTCQLIGNMDICIVPDRGSGPISKQRDVGIYLRVGTNIQHPEGPTRLYQVKVDIESSRMSCDHSDIQGLGGKVNNKIKF